MRGRGKEILVVGEYVRYLDGGDCFMNTLYIHKHTHTHTVALSVKSLPAMQETQVQSLGKEDPLEKEIATHSSILPRRIPWTE